MSVNPYMENGPDGPRVRYNTPLWRIANALESAPQHPTATMILLSGDVGDVCRTCDLADKMIDKLVKQADAAERPGVEIRVAVADVKHLVAQARKSASKGPKSKLDTEPE